MIRSRQRAAILLTGLACITMEAHAHRPVIIDGGPTTFETAHAVPDPEVSYVGYHERSPEAPELWFTFRADAGTALFFQPGVPEIARFMSLRPAIVLLGPGLPAIDVPFAIPAGYGGHAFPTDVQEPVRFEEAFTGTNSWQFAATRLTAPETGRYYLVGYIPGGGDGKFWMALGEREVFGIADILTLPQTLVQVRLFHEVFPLGGILGWVLVLLLGVIAGFFALFTW